MRNSTIPTMQTGRSDWPSTQINHAEATRLGWQQSNMAAYGDLLNAECGNEWPDMLFVLPATCRGGQDSIIAVWNVPQQIGHQVQQRCLQRGSRF